MDAPIPLMTNAELANAIAYTSGRISQVGPATEQYWAFCNHLRELLAIQKQHAAPPAAPRVERYGDGVLVHWPEGMEQYVCVGDCVTGNLGAMAVPEGMTVKEAWWDGARAALGIEDDTPRAEVAAAFIRAAERAAPPAALAVPAVDKARFESAPCYLCGYNGPGYYQPSQHPCAAGYHAQQPAAAVVPPLMDFLLWAAGWRETDEHDELTGADAVAYRVAVTIHREMLAAANEENTND